MRRLTASDPPLARVMEERCSRREHGSRPITVDQLGEFLYRVTEPVLRPIRNVLPNLGGIDLSPVVLFLIIIFIRYVIALYILPNVY